VPSIEFLTYSDISARYIRHTENLWQKVVAESWDLGSIAVYDACPVRTAIGAQKALDVVFGESRVIPTVHPSASAAPAIQDFRSDSYRRNLVLFGDDVCKLPRLAALS